MNLRTAQKARTRAAILDAAADLFTQRGFTNVNTADVAAAAGVSHGLIFAHFPTRQDLVIAVINRFGEAAGKRLHAAVEKRSSLRGILEAHLQCLGENELLYARLIGEAQVLPDAARKTLIGLQSMISYHLYQVAEWEMRQGRIISMPNDLLFNTWLGLVHYYLLNRELFAPNGSVIQAFGKKLCNHYLRLLSTNRKEVRHVGKKVHRLRNADGKG